MEPFREGGSEAPTLQPEIDRLRREKREREAKKQAKHAQQVLEKRQRTLDAFCVAAPPRADVASSSSNLPQPSQSSQPPVATQSQPQSDSNRKGKERAPSSQPKPHMWHWGIVRNMGVLCSGKVVCNFLELGQFGSPNSKGVSKGCAWGLFGGNIV